MGLTSLPTRVSGSVGADKSDSVIKPYSTTILPSGEWNNLAQAGVDVSHEVGLHDGTTSGSLVAKVKEFIRWEMLSGSLQFSSSNPLPSPSQNTGFVNPRLTIATGSLLPGNRIIELTADGISTSTYHSAVWWFDTPWHFQSAKIEYSSGLGVSQSIPNAGDFILAGIIIAADITSGSGLGFYTGFALGTPMTWFIRSDNTGSGELYHSTSVGAYSAKTEMDFFASHVQGSAPIFIYKYYGIDVIDGSATKLMSSAQIGLNSASWISGSANRVGLVLFGSCSNPVTMSISDFKIYPRPGDSGAPLI